MSQINHPVKPFRATAYHNGKFVQVTDQDLRGRDTSKLLLYLDPTIDINIGDLFKARELRETYVGIGASHRSGIFGSARLFNNVNGGSNYLYGFVEVGF